MLPSMSPPLTTPARFPCDSVTGYRLTQSGYRLFTASVYSLASLPALGGSHGSLQRCDGCTIAHEPRLAARMRRMLVDVFRPPFMGL